ncbi:hypothetical protein PsB1_0179 [Candidatus Phycosocius spiralis]|uniref:Uncharacterized protein n=1 Tax=Candidatus Phycosocius spiralis TaxID=2815099 RepID=A0ABQ4PSP0_9PROT|nr:hypothetical protein PsB1_0179 [Candidatus Phycosocius spiralis]
MGALVGLSACASGPDKQQQLQSNSTKDTDTIQDDLGEAASQAVIQPFRDFGVVREKIPDALARISNPYAPPSGDNCQWINYEIKQLDDVLKSEIPPPEENDSRSLQEKSGSMVQSGVTEAVRGAGSSLIPGRGLIRMISGAERSDRLVREAQQRGMVRRGYLKGLAHSKGC